jgi:large subunit ribosomal protein L32
MAVPKKKSSKAKVRSRRAANWVLRPPARSVCPQCHGVKQPHMVCPHCGFYRGRQVIEVD